MLRGTLDPLVVETPSWSPMVAFESSTWIEERCDGRVRVDDASLLLAAPAARIAAVTRGRAVALDPPAARLARVDEEAAAIEPAHLRPVAAHAMDQVGARQRPRPEARRAPPQGRLGVSSPTLLVNLRAGLPAPHAKRGLLAAGRDRGGRAGRGGRRDRVSLRNLVTWQRRRPHRLSRPIA